MTLMLYIAGGAITTFMIMFILSVVAMGIQDNRQRQQEYDDEPFNH